MPICRTCEREFVRKTTRAGYIDQCDRCAKDEEPRHLGRMSGKHGDCEIFRGTAAINARPAIRREMGGGMHPSLGIANPIGIQHYEDNKNEGRNPK